MIPKLLIYGTSYVETQEQRYAFSLWLDLVTKLNPEAHILIVDSASPSLPNTGRAEVLQLGDNIGHLTKTGRDGWGRAFCAGLEYAIAEKYRYAVHIETDLLFARPCSDITAKMATYKVWVAAPMAFPYQFMETALMFMQPCYMDWLKFIDKYDWEHMTRDSEFPEIKVKRIIGKALFSLFLWGMRAENHMTAGGLRRAFPDGMDWITHADPALCRAFLEMNGL